MAWLLGDFYSTVVAEDMMYSKIRITSEVIGMAQYIDDGKMDLFVKWMMQMVCVEKSGVLFSS